MLHPDLVDGRAVEELHDEERGAVLGDVVVDDGDRAGVHHRVRDVPLAEEARAHRLSRREVGVEHLDREHLAIAVLRHVDGRHAADAEDALERVLPAQDDADARTRQVEGVVVGHLVSGENTVGGLAEVSGLDSS